VLVALAGACSSSKDRSPRTAATVPATSTAPTTTTTSTSTVTPSSAPAPPPVPVPQGPARALLTVTGVVVPVTGRVGDAYVVRTPCGGAARLTGGIPLAGTPVVLDPGHGGDEAGAVGANGLTEAALNLAVVRQAQVALAAAGIPVVLTRTGDYRVTLATRAQVVTSLRPRAFVSVHHNAMPDGPFPRPGTETYFQIGSAPSKRLAGLLWEEVVRALSVYKVAWVADTDAGAKYRPNSSGGDYYGILRSTAGTPAALAELAFLSDPAEAELLARPDVQAAEGRAVARGVIRFLTTSDPGSGFTVPYPRTEPAGPGGGAAGCKDPAL
jgi:N-acetylmuramoyl-L-alanine amidase